ncbi:hypothetical protein [Polycladospora coralii]|nr:hypothetical protein [Polycladospora coralii]
MYEIKQLNYHEVAETKGIEVVMDDIHIFSTTSIISKCTGKSGV